jgi:hypothetical protein
MEVPLPASALAGKPSGVSGETVGGNGLKIPALPRKIIYTAELDLVAPDLSKAERELRRWVKSMGGYVSGAEVSGASGSSREGTWTVRIPVGRYDAFVDEVSRLGEVQSVNTQSEDVSEEYYDLGARLTAKRVEEARLLKHLQRSTTRLTDILAVERELSRVHTEIEQMVGRLRFRTNQTEYTTVTVTLHEAKSYTPPVPTTLATQIGRTWGGSIHSLAVAGKSALLVGVALIPWLALVGLPLLAVGLWARRRGWLRAVPAPAE